MTKGLYTASFVIVLGILFLPIGVSKIIFASAILLFYPGFLISQYLLKDQSQAFFVSPVIGTSFWILISYMLSEVGLVRAESAVVISFIFAVLLDIKGNRPHLQKWMIPLLVCMAFSSLYFYQWNAQLIPPLDDAKIHSFFIVSIENLHQLPKDYGMYTEIPRLTYPLGYHAVVSLVKQLSGQSLFPAVTLSTWILLLYTPVCFYIFASPYGEMTALFSAFSFSFLSIFFHRLEQTSTYPNLLALEIFILSLYALQKVLENFSFKKAVITSLLIAAAIETHVYVFLLYAPFLTLHGLYMLMRKDTTFKYLVVVIFLSGLFIIPYGVRLEFSAPHEEELQILGEWYNMNALDTSSKLLAALSSMSPALFLLSIVGLPASSKKDFVILFLLASTVIIPILSILEIEYPAWYYVPPNRFLNFACIPLCVFSGKGIARLVSTAGRKVLVVLVILSLLLHFTEAFYPWSWVPGVSETNPPDDIDVIEYMKTLPPDSVILNINMWYNPSQWIPSVAERKVFLPPFSFHGGDHCIYYLKTPERIQDLSKYLNNCNSPAAIGFLKKYSIDYIFIPSLKQSVTGQPVETESFLNSLFYTVVYQKGESYLFKVDYFRFAEGA